MADVITHEQYLRDLGAVALAIPERDPEAMGRVREHLEHWEGCSQCLADSETLTQSNAEICFRVLLEHHDKATPRLIPYQGDVEGLSQEEKDDRWPFFKLCNLLRWKWNAKRARECQEDLERLADEREAAGVVDTTDGDFVGDGFSGDESSDWFPDPDKPAKPFSAS